MKAMNTPWMRNTTIQWAPNPRHYLIRGAQKSHCHPVHAKLFLLLQNGSRDCCCKHWHKDLVYNKKIKRCFFFSLLGLLWKKKYIFFLIPWVPHNNPHCMKLPCVLYTWKKCFHTLCVALQVKCRLPRLCSVIWSHLEHSSALSWT